jgi:hypothetical protein
MDLRHDRGSLVNNLAGQPHTRRLVVVVDPIAYGRTEYADMRAMDARVDVVIVNAGEPGHDQISQSLLREGLLRPGNVLVQSPFDTSRYSEISVASERFALDKAMLFSKLCQRLGAREVRVKNVYRILDGKRREITVGAGDGLIVGARADLDREDFSTFAASVHLVDAFTGGPPDIRAARKLLRECGLEQDPVMSSLVESRANPSNTHRSRRLYVDLSTETVNRIRFAAGLAIPSFFAMNVDVKTVTTKASEYQVAYEVDF